MQESAHNAHKSKPPSEQMLSAACKIAEARGIHLPQGIERSFDICRAFLDEVLSQPAPPTQGMRELAECIAQEDGLELGDALTTFEACKAFLDKHVPRRQKNSPPTRRMLAAARAAVLRRGTTLPPEVEQSFAACRAFLEAHARH